MYIMFFSFLTYMAFTDQVSLDSLNLVLWPINTWINIHSNILGFNSKKIGFKPGF
jgi:hypothetical protein